MPTRIHGWRRLLPGIAAALAAGVVAAGNDLRILIPLYNYPTWWTPATYIWTNVVAAARQVPVCAIIDPADGPDGPAPNADYQHGMDDLRAGGVEMLGYVDSNYGNRPIAAVKSNIDTYATGWNVNGIFVDQASTAANRLAYYGELYDYIHSRTGLARVVINPGTVPDETYVSRPAADVTVWFENSNTDWSAWSPPVYGARHPMRGFGALVYDCATAAAMTQVVDQAVARRSGWVYVTDDRLPNPWDTLPPYWTALVGRVKYWRTRDGGAGLALMLR